MNNALGVIGTLTDLLLEDRAADDPDRADLEEIRNAVRRAAESMRKLAGSQTSLTRSPSDTSGVPRAATILLVDADMEARGRFRRRLLREGFSVVDSASWDEAESLVRSGGLRPDLLVSSDPGPAGARMGVSGAELPHVQARSGSPASELVARVRSRLAALEGFG